MARCNLQRATKNKKATMQEGKESEEQIKGRIEGAMRIYSIHTGGNSKAIQKIREKNKKNNREGKNKNNNIITLRCLQNAKSAAIGVDSFLTICLLYLFFSHIRYGWRRV